ncbi:WD40-repeat-containing domain protein [Catenaria anguillulae PL171]|uniref:WD40-repeat-containing domain protein n=1 Tax=Catenaria anguillulae PL171 TaxID=765915 RepID=A0A1Y2H5J7_9FUNG|nr:WD40-repeat-containing domain protein [Catenaria anguillulae PL171]
MHSDAVLSGPSDSDCAPALGLPAHANTDTDTPSDTNALTPTVTRFTFVPDFATPPARIASSGPLIPSALPTKIPTLNNYTRQVAWSLDHTTSYLASMHNDRSVRLWPSATFLSSTHATASTELTNANANANANNTCTPARYSMAESITDMAWSPSPVDPPMLAISCPSQPIHLIAPPFPDDSSGPVPTPTPTRLATYAAPTHLDLLIGPTSLSFHPHYPQRLVAGYPHAKLHAFDLTQPSGSPSTSPSPTGTSNNNNNNKLKGILSSLVHLPAYSSLAVSSYSSLMYLVDASSLTPTHTIRHLPPATCLSTDPLSSTYLVSSHRNGLIACHDVRDVRGPVWTWMRAAKSNMRTSVQVLDNGWVAIAGCGPGASQVHAVDLATGAMQRVVMQSHRQDEVVAACSVVGGGQWWATGQGSRRYQVESMDEGQLRDRDNSVNVWQVAGQWLESKT